SSDDPFAGLFGDPRPAEPAPGVIQPADTSPASPYPLPEAYPPAESNPADGPTAPASQPDGQFVDLFRDPGHAAPAPVDDTVDLPVDSNPTTEATPTDAPSALAFQSPSENASDNPFAGMFGDPRQAAPAPSAPVEPAVAPSAAPDPFGAPLAPLSPSAEALQPTHEYTPDAPFPTTATARFTPREDDDPFAALFGTAAESATPVSAAAAAGGLEAEAPRGRRDDRDNNSLGPNLADSGFGAGRGGRDGSNGGSGSGKPRKRHRLLWLKITLPIVIVLALVAGVGVYAWTNYETQVRTLLGIPLPTDYTGNGNGKQVIVTIQSGDIGETIAHTLHDKGVTLTFTSFYDLLLAQKEQPNFQPGNFKLQEHMSAKAALKALLDPANKVTDKLLITEGTVLPKALEIISETTGIALAELQTASTDLAGLGLPADAVSLEGYLFPATYQLDAGMTAHDVLQLLVTTMFEHLDSAGVAPADRNKVLIMASLIQREAGPKPDDFYKISRVFANRLAQGINFESDATVAYGTGHLDTVFTTDEERADASNLYNTYVHPGLPYGPIGLPGDLAIKAALHPVDGPWLFFVPINLATGETVFSETVEQHDAAVEQLQEWCAASAENGSYCN
ncbi:MAG: endolytic transglycosylase MltG, partial [Rhodoglobus sp.]